MVSQTDLALGQTRGTFYPSPFYDVAKTYMPKNMRDMFRWCQFYLDNNPIIQQSVRRMSSYPITKIVPNSEDTSARTKMDRIVNDIQLREFCMNISMHYFAFGNAFTSVIPAFKREYRCKECGYGISVRELHDMQDKLEKERKRQQAIKKSKRANQNTLVVAYCPSCNGEQVPVDVVDRPVKSIKETKLVLWHPLNIRIVYNPISGTKQYKFVMPSSMKAAICDGDMFMLNSSPKIFVDASIQGKDIVMNDNAMFHFRRTSVDANTGWGHSIIQGVLRELFHAQVIKKASEALAMQHVIPLMVVYPKNQSGVNVYQDMDLGTWRASMVGELRKWRDDPNHIPVMPIPIGIEYIGGQHKGLDPTQILERINDEIIMGMGVPKEFLLGGTSFSGTSVALRMLENDFMNLRTLLLEYMNEFLLPLLAKTCDIPVMDVKFSNLRTADDIQQRDLLMRLMESGKISSSTVLDDMGYDYDQENKKIIQEMKEQADQQKRMGAEEAGLGGTISNLTIPMNGSSGRGSSYMGGNEEAVSFIADMMMNSPDDAQQFYMQYMKQRNPRMYDAVSGRMSGAGGTVTTRPSEDRRPNPDQKPPRRKNSPV